MKKALFFTVLLAGALLHLHAQDSLSMLDRVTNFPTKFLSRTQERAHHMNDQLMHQTERYLQKLQKQEQKMSRRLMKVDSVKAKQLFAGSEEKYRHLLTGLRADSGRLPGAGGEYLPYMDSLKGSLAFLQQHKDLLGHVKGVDDMLKGSLQEVGSLQSRLQQTEQVKAFIRERRAALQQAFSQYTHLPKGLTSAYDGYTKEAYYYSEQVRSYKEMLNDPDQLSKKALAALNKLPAFQQFMQQHSELASLFRVPAGYGSVASLAGLQTRDQVQGMIQRQVAAGGSGAQQALQQNLQAAQAQLNQFKDKISQLGQGSGDMDMPEFKPNPQRTKTFLQRLEYGTNLQTTRSDYFFPTTTDIGLSVGYKLNNRSTMGLGASYKIGWGKDIRHIAITNQGVGLRSFVDVKLKGSFYASGGFEYNYQQPFRSVQHLPGLNDWQQSGLIGVSKIVSLKSKLFKKTKVQLLWDFLSYGQRPEKQPIIFRAGYTL